MSELLDIILDFCRKDTTEVDELPFLKLLPHAQANNSGAEHHPRPVPENLSASELKLILVIIQQTYGWIDNRTGKRKTRDRISESQFRAKTSLCAKIISKALQSLVTKGWIAITDRTGNLLPYFPGTEGAATALIQPSISVLCSTD